MRKTENTGWAGRDSVEQEDLSGAHSAHPADVEVKDSAEDLLEKLLSRANLNAAYKKVKKNGGAPGVDRMTVEEAAPYLNVR